ncbi:thiol reductant ABC exporter subunit CydC [Salinicola socius]|uniref:Thiol reductant ABC exporter subunit CydC n=1 Tax=Salinicola socius TaxID=404433 RepID=A0A1Q8SPM0_9GAMM|nr:thiol reductant ABC exporter subunit CydC [Salinicola socius]OLO03372.1 thiol reductant ABC exporter subunit CydC [Salinicola socius]
MKALMSLRPWLGLLAERRGRLLIGALLMLATLLSALGLLTLSGWFITATAIAAASASGYLDVFTPGSGIRFFAVSRTGSRYLERLYNHDTILRLLADLRGRVFAGLVALDARTLAGARASQWLNRLTADIDTLDNLYLRLLAPPLVAFISIVAFAAFAAVFLPVAGVVLLAILLPLGLVATAGCACWGWQASHRRVDRQERLRVRAIEQVEGLAELSAYQALDTHRRHWQREEQALLDDQRLLGRRTATGNLVVTLGIQLATVAVLLLGLEAFRSGAVSGPVMVMLALGTLAVSEGLANLPMAFTQLGATVRAAERLNTQAELKTPLTGAKLQDAPSTSSGAAPSLNYRNVEVVHGSRAVFSDLNLAIEPGQRIGIIGASGIGKSTLAQLAVRAFDPQRGCVEFSHQDLAAIAPESLRARIGYLTQRSELFHDTLAANLRMGDPDASDLQLWDVLERVELKTWTEALPEGLETWVGEQGRQLSGGQARRVALARVMLRNSPLVILDEPLSGLDADTAATLKATLDGWLAGRTALLLGHDRLALPTCDHYWQLMPGEKGSVLAKT